MSSEGKISLDNCDFSTKGKRLNSPTSLEACRLIGVDPNELYSISFEEFILLHPECKNIDKSLQEERYEHFEENRKANVDAAKGKRSELLEGEKSNKSKTQNNNSTTNENVTSTAIKQEQERLEKMRKRQANNLKLMIDYEFELEENRKKNEEKIRKQQEKEEQIKAEKMKRSMEMSKKEQEKEKE